MKPITIKVVIVTLFDDHDIPDEKIGELFYWKKNLSLNKKIPFQYSENDLYLNEDNSILTLCTGIGSTRSAIATMALGLDGRFDLRSSYWLVAGVAGGNPNRVSLASAVWCNYIIDGDLCHQIDSREIPQGWQHGIFPLFCRGPNDKDNPHALFEIFQLNQKIIDWALQLTQKITLSDSPTLKKEREQYQYYPAATKQPSIIQGGQLSSKRFWHGERLNQWAEHWVSWASKGSEQFVVSAMEDSGILQSLWMLSQDQKIDYDRILVLRSVSNYTLPPSGKKAMDCFQDKEATYTGMEFALKHTFEVAHTVVQEIINHWQDYKAKDWESE